MTDIKLLEKWEPILEYTSNEVPPIDDITDKLRVAKLCENTELMYKHEYTNHPDKGYMKSCKTIIPFIRINYEDLSDELTEEDLFIAFL